MLALVLAAEAKFRLDDKAITRLDVDGRLSR